MFSHTELGCSVQELISLRCSKRQQVPKQLSPALRTLSSVLHWKLLAQLATPILNADYRLLSTYLETEAVNDTYSREVKPWIQPCCFRVGRACFSKKWRMSQHKNMWVEFLSGKDRLKTTLWNVFALLSAKANFSLTLWTNFYNMLSPQQPLVGHLSVDFQTINKLLYREVI